MELRTEMNGSQQIYISENILIISPSEPFLKN